MIRSLLTTRIAKCLFLAATLILAAISSVRAEDAKALEKKSSPTSKPIKLKPVLKKQPVTVKLDPVFKKIEIPKPETAAPTPATSPTAGPITGKPLPSKTDAAAIPVIDTSASTTAVAPVAGPATPPAPVPTATTMATNDTATSGAVVAVQPTGPKTQTRLTAEQLMMQGKGLLDKGQVAAARERFLKLANRYPEAPEAPEALYHAANSVPEPEIALEELDALAQKYPAAEILPQVRARQAEFSFVLERYPDAARYYADVLAGQPDPELAKLAEARIVYCLARTGKPGEFATAGSGLIEKYPDMADIPELIGPLAEAKLVAGDTRAAGELFARLEQKASEPAQAAKALLGRGLCAELEGKTTEAAGIYDRLSQAHPQSPEATLAAYRLVDLGKPLLP